METVKEIMRDEVYIIREDQKIRDLLYLFIEKNISGAPVLGEDNKLTGIITDADILGQIHEYPSFLDFMTFVVAVDAEALADANITNMLDRPVKELMTKNVITVEEDTNIILAAKLFSKKKFKKIPVVKDNRLVGILTRSDMIHYIVHAFLEKV